MDPAHEAYLSTLLTLELCAEVHRNNGPKGKVKNCIIRLLPGLRHHEQVMHIYFNIGLSADPLKGLRVLRQGLNDAFGGPVTIED